jgi:hypothetical protein
MKNLRIYSLLVIFLLTGIVLHAQNFSEDYKKLFKTYMEHKQISLGITYSVYSDLTGNTVVQNEKGFFRMDGSKVYQIFEQTENLENSPYHVYVDHKRRFIVMTEKTPAYLKIEKKANKKMKPDFAYQLIDSTIPYLKKVEYKGIKDGAKEYLLVPKTGSKEMLIAINTSTWLLDKITVYSNAPISSKGRTLARPRLEITYRNINLHPLFTAKDFSIAKYGFFQKNGKFLLSPDYKNYKLDYKKT